MKPNRTGKTMFKFTINGSDAANLLVYFVLESNLKNNFTMGPFLTNEKGIIELCSANSNKAITCTENEFPMDYAGFLKDCTNLVVLVETIKDLQVRVSRLREFYPEKAETLEILIKKASNHLCMGARIVYPLPVTADIIEVKLNRNA